MMANPHTPSLPSFVELLSTLGLSDTPTSPPALSSPRYPQYTLGQRGRHTRSSSSSSASSDTAASSLQTPSDERGPYLEPLPLSSASGQDGRYGALGVRLSGRHASNGGISKNARRFSPYEAKGIATLDRRGSLPTLSLPGLPESTTLSTRRVSASPPMSKRRPSLPSLMENELSDISPRSPPRRLARKRPTLLSLDKSNTSSLPICTLLRKSPTSPCSPASPRQPRSPGVHQPMSLPTLPLVPYNAPLRPPPSVTGVSGSRISPPLSGCFEQRRPSMSAEVSIRSPFNSTFGLSSHMMVRQRSSPESSLSASSRSTMIDVKPAVHQPQQRSLPPVVIVHAA